MKAKFVLFSSPLMAALTCLLGWIVVILAFVLLMDDSDAAMLFGPLVGFVAVAVVATTLPTRLIRR